MWPMVVETHENWYLRPDGVQFLCSLAEEVESEPMDVRPRMEDVALAIERINLATTLDERITTVLAGEAPVGADFALSDVLLPLGQLVDAATPVFGGYKAGIDLLRCGICGEENSLLPFADAAGGGAGAGRSPSSRGCSSSATAAPGRRSTAR